MGVAREGPNPRVRLWPVHRTCDCPADDAIPFVGAGIPAWLARRDSSTRSFAYSFVGSALRTITPSAEAAEDDGGGERGKQRSPAGNWVER